MYYGSLLNEAFGVGFTVGAAFSRPEGDGWSATALNNWSGPGLDDNDIAP
jgi:hypothetical protein